jgi:uncharacterized protein YwgA/O-acetyl-ADP-ribose deacetylase (regulator of RNase III)
MATKNHQVHVEIGDLFGTDAQTLVNTVNTVGVMGKGVALEFKKRFPDMFDDYVLRCQRKEVRLGEPYLYRRLIPPYILNFPTKEHWRSVSRLSDIVAGLDFLCGHYKEWGIESIACPPLGCGQGGLEWRVVGPLLYQALAQLDIPVTLFAPFGTAHNELNPEYLAQRSGDVGVSDGPKYYTPSRIRPAWIALVAILARLERNRYRWPVGRTTFQKLTYFATVAGVPTGLDFSKGVYGPYAESLKSIQTKLVNNGLVTEHRLGGRMIEYQVGPTYIAALREFGADVEKWSMAVERVASLLARMRTSDAEIAATAHFAARMAAHDLGRTPTEREVLDVVLEWKQRKKPPLRERDVAETIRDLALLGWLDAEWSADLPVEDLSEVAF